MGIPNVIITPFTSVALSVGANRIVHGGDFTCPAGDPNLPIEREKYFRRQVLLKSLEALTAKVEKPTLFTVDLKKGVQS